MSKTFASKLKRKLNGTQEISEEFERQRKLNKTEDLSSLDYTQYSSQSQQFSGPLTSTPLKKPDTISSTSNELNQNEENDIYTIFI